MSLPKSIRVNNLTYTLQERHSRDVFGECDYNNQTILIDHTRPYDRQVKVMLHELMHAGFYEHGAREYANNEELVGILENVLFDLLRNNDFSWVNDQEQEEVVFIPTKKNKKENN